MPKDWDKINSVNKVGFRFILLCLINFRIFYYAFGGGTKSFALKSTKLFHVFYCIFLIFFIHINNIFLFLFFSLSFYELDSISLSEFLFSLSEYGNISACLYFCLFFLLLFYCYHFLNKHISINTKLLLLLFS